VCSDTLRKVCRCSELVQRSAVMLSVSSSTSTHHHCQTTSTPHTDTNSLQLDLSSLTQLTGPPTEQSAGACKCVGAQLVSHATDQLCHVIKQHLSQHDISSSSSTLAASTCSSRRMLPIVPGTSIVSGGAGVLASPVVLCCQSARPADRTLSRPVSMMCFPLNQHSNDL